MPMSAREHCALARANRVFRTDEKHIRSENTVMLKSKNGLGLFLCEIIDCARTYFRLRSKRNSAVTGCAI